MYDVCVIARSFLRVKSVVAISFLIFVVAFIFESVQR